MIRIVEFPVEGGGMLQVEVNELDRPGAKPATSAVERATLSLGDAVGKVRPLVSALLASLQDLAREPDELSIEFGMKFDVKAGVVVAETAVQGNCVVKLTWKQAKA
jgi:hypothetical protein